MDYRNICAFAMHNISVIRHCAHLSEALKRAHFFFGILSILSSSIFYLLAFFLVSDIPLPCNYSFSSYVFPLDIIVIIASTVFERR